VLSEAEAWTPVGGGTAVSRTTTHAYDLANRETSLTDPSGLASSTTFDLAGNAVAQTAGGVTTTRTFDGLGRSLTETADGGTTTHLYDAQGNEFETDSAEGSITSRTFTRTGWLLTEVVDPSTLVITTDHGYDRLGRELTTSDPYANPDGTAGASSVTTVTYDRAGRQVTSQITGGPLITTVYDRVGNAVAVKGADGTVSASLIDPLDRVVVRVANCTNSGAMPPAAGVACAGTGTADATTNVTTRTWFDAGGTEIATRDPNGTVTRTVPNVRGLARETIAVCTDDGTSPPQAADPPTCVGDPTPPVGTNIRTTVTYDGTGATVLKIVAVGTGAAATSETAYDGAGRVQAVKDPRGTITRSIYDAAGRLARSVVNCTSAATTIPLDWPICSGAGTSDGTYNLSTTYAYDAAGNQTSVVAPNGRETRTTYDADGRVVSRIENYVDGVAGTTDDLVTSYFFDEAGRQVAIQAPATDGTSFVLTRMLYDTAGRLWKEIRGCTNTGASFDFTNEDPAACGGTGAVGPDANVVVEYRYDARGNRIRLIAPDPSATTGTASATVTTQYAFDAADRLCRVVENATGATNLQLLADPCSSGTQTAGTATANVSTSYSYDLAGNLATMVDASGNTTTYGYDAAGHMTSLRDAMGKTIVWAYDALGNRIRQSNRTDPPLSSSVTWTYDGAGRMQTRTADGITVTYTYDANGNRLTASDGTFAITATYDRLNRPLTVDDEDAGGTPDTTYAYSLTNPSWTDPTGSYSATLDRFDRALSFNDPANATDFTWTYRADALPASASAPNGNVTTFTYDRLGRLVSKDTSSGGVSRADYDWSINRAGQIVSESENIAGGASNGVVSYAYDPLSRLVRSTFGGTPTAYGWGAVPNRTSVQVGTGTPTTTTYDKANRPTSGANPTATYSSDDDGRLTARSGYQYTWDHLGRLATVKNGSGTTLVTYTYDPLDRLRMADYGGGVRIRFRYVGLTTSAAQWLDDAASTVTRSIANDWNGERLVDWTGSGSNLRFYGTNVHHDVTWLAGSMGTVTQSLRYDAWGMPRSAVPSGYTPFRFQGSWYDDTATLSWVVTRWYASSMGRFMSEDSLLGVPSRPPSRHLYSYGEAEPIRNWDPDGRCTTFANLYGDACSAYGYATFQPRFGLNGSLEIGLFIKKDAACFALCLRGDGADRPWSSFPRMDSVRSRGWLRINLDLGTVRGITRPSCSDAQKLQCKDALNIASTVFTFGNYLTAESHWKYNIPKVTGCDDSYVGVFYGYKQSFSGLPSPAINGWVKARRCNSYNEIVVHGDGFPWFEMSYSRPDGRGFGFRVVPGGSEYALLDNVADWTQKFRVAR
jgi:RHS repeat-associated protein